MLFGEQLLQEFSLAKRCSPKKHLIWDFVKRKWTSILCLTCSKRIPIVLWTQIQMRISLRKTETNFPLIKLKFDEHRTTTMKKCESSEIFFTSALAHAGSRFLISPLSLSLSLRELGVLKCGTHSVVFITNIYHFWNTPPLAYWLWIIASYYGEIILE